MTSKNNSSISKSRKKIAINYISKAIPVIDVGAKIVDAKKIINKKIKQFDSINYIYVLNKDNELKGVLSIKEIFRSSPNETIENLMIKKLIIAHEHSSSEKVALLALKNNIKAIPIINKEKKFVGVVPSDEIMNILDQKAVENLMRFGGVSVPNKPADLFDTSILSSIKHRLPWLILGLVGGILAAGIINGFEKVITKNLILASFIPLIIYMSDAVGAQMEAFIIRDLAIREKFNFFKYFTRQASIVFLISLILSFLLYIGSLLFYSEKNISLVISLSLFFAIMSSLVAGLTIPYLFNKIKVDPAIASGPVATIIQDIFSVAIYFTIASLILL